MIPIYAYSRARDGDTSLSANFRVREFACSDGSDPIFIAPALITLLQQLRDRFQKPVRILSGYRTPGKNRACGGALRSQHLYGTAADIAISGVKPEAVADAARKLLGNQGGVGRYASFTHVDVRQKRADWRG